MSATQKKPETEIRSLFNQYSEQLIERKKEISFRLTRWGKDLIKEIEDYVTTQNKNLNAYFDERKCFFENERKRITTAVSGHEKKQETEEIRQLLAECRAIKLSLPVLQSYNKNTEFVRVLPNEQVALEESKQNNAQARNENSSNNQLSNENNNATTNNATASGTPSIRPPSARPPSARNRPLK